MYATYIGRIAVRSDPASIMSRVEHFNQHFAGRSAGTKGLFFFFAHLLREIALIAEFADLVHLRLEEVHMLFFVL